MRSDFYDKIFGRYKKQDRLLENILKELELDGDVVDKQGVIGRLKIRKHGPIVFIWFKPNSNNEDPYSWNVDDNIINEINRFTQDFHKA